MSTFFGHLLFGVLIVWILTNAKTCKGEFYLDGKRHIVEVPFTKEAK